MRIDNHGGDRAVKVRNIRIDNVYVQGTGSQGVETYGVDGLTIRNGDRSQRARLRSAAQ